MITRPPENADTLLKAAKIKLSPVIELLSACQTLSLDTAQLLANCNLSYEEYVQSLQALTNSSVVILKLDPKDCWVNSYNPYLLDAWDANIDTQYILNPYRCIMYITSYITKAEHSMRYQLPGSDYIQSVYDIVNRNKGKYE